VSAKGEGIQSFLNGSLCQTNKTCKGFPFGDLFKTNEGDEVVGVYESQSFSDDG
jgi:hypothetical protein